ncbi:MAG: N-acetylneuraminate synthase family protein [Chitinophagaceae bacterium]|nr:N-acetylneuraminate synthase family protein [Chitinophagaceae bacterium]
MNYVIIEVANTHGGSIDYLNNLIEEYEDCKDGFGIKFQPLHPDELATPDFQWYPVYQKLHFESKTWQAVINKSAATKDVWIDVFDSYGVQIIEENIDKVYGIKLQVSVLYNFKVIDLLSKLNLSDKKLIINIAALSIEEIDFFLNKIENSLNPDEVFIEVGFQGYPTELIDSGISKIQQIKKRFNKKIVFADHIDKNDVYAVWMPVLAIASGADIIEKHVMLSNVETEYDHYSSLIKDQFSQMVSVINEYTKLINAPFINQRETTYLSGTIMKPLLKKGKKAGELVDLTNEFDFKRSGKNGLNSKEILNLSGTFHLLNKNKRAGETLQKEDFKKANIAVIIACRLKSTRLKDKALLKIGDMTSVEYCIKNACKFSNVNHVVLATSDLPSDEGLKDYTYSENVIFHQGHPEDVIQRYLDIIDHLKIDVVIRVTADMPFIDDEICSILLREHFESGADYTTATKAAVGTNLEIINTTALKKVKEFFPSAAYSEYMTWYFQNNPEHFKLNFIELPASLVRDYRLTLDHDEDLQMFNLIHQKLQPEFGINQIYKLLDEHADIVAVNSHITLKYKTDTELINTLNEKTKIK